MADLGDEGPEQGVELALAAAAVVVGPVPLGRHIEKAVGGQ